MTKPPSSFENLDQALAHGYVTVSRDAQIALERRGIQSVDIRNPVWMPTVPSWAWKLYALELADDRRLHCLATAIPIEAMFAGAKRRHQTAPDEAAWVWAWDAFIRDDEAQRALVAMILVINKTLPPDLLVELDPAHASVIEWVCEKALELVNETYDAPETTTRA